MVRLDRINPYGINIQPPVNPLLGPDYFNCRIMNSFSVCLFLSPCVAFCSKQND